MVSSGVKKGGFAVSALIEDPALPIALSVIAGGSGLSRAIEHPRIQKSGLALVGHKHGIVPTRVQVLGETELVYLEGLDAEGQRAAAKHLFSMDLSCVLVTRGASVPVAIVEEAEASHTPLLGCAERSSAAIIALHAVLDERLAPRTRIHGVLVDVFEVGVLLLGESGIGKSECALELVMRGHRLVADDVVECDYRPPGMVFAEPADLLRHHIEVRGLGILNIKDLFGVTAIRARKRIDLVIQLKIIAHTAPMDRLGGQEKTFEILGVPVREVTLPVLPGRNTSAIIEIAARNELLRQAGHDAHQAFIQTIDAGIRRDFDSERYHERPASSLQVESSIPPPVHSRKP